MDTEPTDDADRPDSHEAPWNFDEIFAVLDDEIARGQLPDEQRAGLERLRASLLERQAELAKIAAERAAFIAARDVELAARQAEIAALDAEIAMSDAKLFTLFVDAGVDEAEYDKATPEEQKAMLDQVASSLHVKKLRRFYSGEPSERAKTFNDAFTYLQDAIDAFHTLRLPRALRLRMFELVDGMAARGVKLPAFPTFARFVDVLLDAAGKHMQPLPDGCWGARLRERRSDTKRKLRNIASTGTSAGTVAVMEWCWIMLDAMDHVLGDDTPSQSENSPR